MSSRGSVAGNTLVIAGALIAVGTVGAIAAGVQIDLSPAMVHLLAFKALGAAAVGLIVAGSWIGRGATRRQSSIVGEGDRPELSERSPGTEATLPATMEKSTVKTEPSASSL